MTREPADGSAWIIIKNADTELCQVNDGLLRVQNLICGGINKA